MMKKRLWNSIIAPHFNRSSIYPKPIQRVTDQPPFIFQFRLKPSSSSISTSKTFKQIKAPLPYMQSYVQLRSSLKCVNQEIPMFKQVGGFLKKMWLFQVMTRTTGQKVVGQVIVLTNRHQYRNSSQSQVADTVSGIPQGHLIDYLRQRSRTDVTRLVKNAKVCCPTGYRECWCRPYSEYHKPHAPSLIPN